YIEAIGDAVARRAAAASPPPHAGVAAGRPRRRAAAEAWLEALCGNPLLDGDAEDLSAFEQAYRAWTEPAEGATESADGFRVCFRLDPPAESPEPAPSADRARWTIEYLLQARNDPSLL